MNNNSPREAEQPPEVQDGPPLEHARALSRRLAAIGTAAHALESLEPLGAHIDRALAHLESAFDGMAQPLSPPEREAVAAAQSLALEAARAYANAARTLERQRPASRRLAPVILQAMRYVAAMMRESYVVYAKLPTGAWKELHALYAMAERAVVANGCADREDGESVLALYGRMLVLALVDPYRLRQGEVHAVEALLRECGTALSVTGEPPESAPGSHFRVELEEDKPPRPWREEDANAGAATRCLDAGPLADLLRKRSAGSVVTSSGEERATLAARLAAFLHDPPQRALLREAAGGSVAICVGVKPIAHFVAHEGSPREAQAEEAALRERLTMPLHALPEDERGHLIPIHEWSVLNQSRGGLRLRRDASTDYPIVVGEVVGIREPGKAQWRIGVTRWITGLSEGATEFGIQFFANAVCAVWLRQRGPAAERKLGLLVAEGEHNSEELLLAPPGTYVESAEYEIRGEELRSRVKAAALVEANACFDLFRIVPG